ncbi:hypothetical protein GCK32_018068 [Trichostrongylus colubriformis]|uniref:Uncharacterized protein n=1 Tax=Trichostrongylus colubriformis TaxID=6319 RepID=A0AAN8FMF6_TRICO
MNYLESYARRIPRAYQNRPLLSPLSSFVHATITFRFKLTCLNPTLVVGPLLIDEEGASVTVIRRFLNGEMPAVPKVNLALVDVRDVAKAHLIAMKCPETDGERILITSQPSFWFRDIARILGKEFRHQGGSTKDPFNVCFLVETVLVDDKTDDDKARISLPSINSALKRSKLSTIHFHV